MAQGREEAYDSARHQAGCRGKAMGSVGTGKLRELVEATAELNEAAIIAKALQVDEGNACRFEVAGAGNPALFGEGERPGSRRFYDVGHRLLCNEVSCK